MHNCCALLFSAAFLLTTLPLLGLYSVFAERSDALTLAAIQEAETAATAQAGAEAAEGRADADAEKAAADRAEAARDEEQAAAASGETAEAEAKAAEYEEQAAAARGAEDTDHAAAAEAGETAAADEAEAEAERSKAVGSSEDAAASEAEAEADEASTAALTFIPGVDLVADAVGGSIAMSLHVKEAAEVALAASLAAKGEADEASAGAAAATAAGKEAAAEAAEAEAEAKAAAAAEQQEASAEASQTAQEEQATATEMEEASAAEEGDAAAQRGAEAAEEEIAGRAASRAFWLRLQAFVFELLTLVVISPLALCVVARKAAKTRADILEDCLAVGVVAKDLYRAAYLYRRRAGGGTRAADAERGAPLLPPGTSAADELRVAEGFVMQHACGIFITMLFATPAWLRGVKAVGHADRQNFEALCATTVLAARRMLVTCLWASLLVAALQFALYLLDHRKSAIDGEKMLWRRIFKSALQKASHAVVRTLSTGMVLVVVGLLFSWFLRDLTSAACRFMLWTWSYGAYQVGLLLALLTAGRSLYIAWECPVCTLWHDDGPHLQDRALAAAFVAALRAGYVGNDADAMEQFYESSNLAEELKPVLQSLEDRVKDAEDPEAAVALVERKLGVTDAGVQAQQKHGLFDVGLCGCLARVCHLLDWLAIPLRWFIGFFQGEIELAIFGLGLKQWLTCGTIISLTWPFVWAHAPSAHLVHWLTACDVLVAGALLAAFAYCEPQLEKHA